jgi:hypothetical protein
MRGPRLEIGRDVHEIEEAGDCVRLEGRVRLAPGQRVQLCSQGVAGSSVRRAVVLSWAVSRLSGEGPRYQGVCRIDG